MTYSSKEFIDEGFEKQKIKRQKVEEKQQTADLHNEILDIINKLLIPEKPYTSLKNDEIKSAIKLSYFQVHSSCNYSLNVTKIHLLDILRYALCQNQNMSPEDEDILDEMILSKDENDMDSQFKDECVSDKEMEF